MIKRGNLSASLKQWLMSTLQLGPGIGNVFYLCPAASATSGYRQSLVEQGLDGAHIFTTLAAGEDALRGDRNDVLLAFPGDYAPAAELVWDKNQTHLVGLGGPNQRHSPAAGTSGMVRFYNTTAAVGSIIKVTGHYVQMQGFQTRNHYSGATNYADLWIQGKNFTGKGLGLRSGGGANQVNTDAGYALWFDTAASGQANCAIFEDCFIGDPFGTARTGGGVIYSDGTTGQGACIEFKRCRIMMTSETASTAVCAIKLAGNYAIDRYLLLEDTLVYNFSVNLGNLPTQAITDNCGTTHMIILTGKTAQYGFTKWCNSGTYLFSALPQANAAGGKAVTITG